MTETNPTKTLELKLEEIEYLLDLIIQDKKQKYLRKLEYDWREKLFFKIADQRNLDREIENSMQFNEHDIDRNKRSKARAREKVKAPHEYKN